MYDRKTWIVLVLCGGLLALSVYENSKRGRALAERQRLEQLERLEREATEQGAKDPSVAAVPQESGLMVEPLPPPTEEELIVLESDEMVFTLTTWGGGIKFAEFKHEYQVGSDKVRVRSNRHGAGAIGALVNRDETIDNIPYRYLADESVAGRKAVFIAQHPSGLIAKKTFSLQPGDQPGAEYLLDFKLDLENQAAGPVDSSNWSLFLGEASPLYQAEFSQQTGFFWREDGDIHFKHGGAFKGGMFSSEKSTIASPLEESLEFAGVTNQFFTTVIRPLAPMTTSVWGKAEPVRIQAGAPNLSSVRAGIQLPATTLQPGDFESYQFRVFIGPKSNRLLRSMERDWGDGWGDLMQYGWFWWVSRPLNWLLNTYHSLLDSVAKNWSWGLAIILLTVTVRVFIWPLHAKSTRTMKRMSKLKPEMDRLKEKYSEDPNKLNTEMMGLYRKYGINPLGGCLPMFIQLPVFFGFYKMLQYAVELRHQGFLWVDDLSQPDTLMTLDLPFALPILGSHLPINVLPMVMACTSFFQIRMTPSTGDKMQQRVIMFMPLIFFFFCYNFASALALYWTTQNIFSIGQTWLMNKIPEPELKPKHAAGKKTWVQRMAERQAEIQKLQKERSAAGGMRNVTPDAKKKRPPRTGG